MNTTLTPEPVAVDGWDTPQMAAAIAAKHNTITWSVDQIPNGWAGSLHIGDGVFAQRCTCHGDLFATYGVVSRWASPVGKHEAAHGQQVAGINVGLLS